MSVATSSTSLHAAVPEAVVFRHENVLGTSMELRVRADSPESPRRAEARILGEMDRLARIFSTYDSSSEFSRWQQTAGQPAKVSGELFAVLSLADAWREASGGAFHPAVESLTRVWKDAAKKGALPLDGELDPARQRAAARAWSLDAAGRTATRLGSAPLTLDAIAKGWILEHAGGLAVKEIPGIRSLLLNVGGDLRHWGDVEERIDVAHPAADAENAPPYTTIRIRNEALATSGGYRRNFKIGGKSYSHIIDPRSGQPASAVAGASVVASDGATADALATILNLVDPAGMPSLNARLLGIDWLVIRSDGTAIRSPKWATRESPASPVQPVLAASKGATRWPDAYRLKVDFELNRPEGGRYARPYVALWVEDAEGFPVRTLLLWLLQGDKGLRWLPDLRRWHRSDQMRSLVDARNLVSTVSAATRPPGKYSAVWDGKDDQGQFVKPGRYTVYLEASREHGTYQLMRHDLEVGAKSSRVDLKGNIEIKSATLDFGPRASGEAGVQPSLAR